MICGTALPPPPFLPIRITHIQVGPVRKDDHCASRLCVDWISNCRFCAYCVASPDAVVLPSCGGTARPAGEIPRARIHPQPPLPSAASPPRACEGRSALPIHVWPACPLPPRRTLSDHAAANDCLPRAARNAAECRGTGARALGWPSLSSARRRRRTPRTVLSGACRPSVPGCTFTTMTTSV